ncbi:MAG TPA: glycosyltransferase [Verrucomicrobia bacterium]|nr:glycosyltransferase [Verrucomicrobiota bacterium]
MTTATPQQVSVVVPFLNELDNLPELYGRLNAMAQARSESFEFIFVDDGSSDASPQWVVDCAQQDPRVKMIRLSRNFGHQIAITAGLDLAEGDAVIVMDADLQDPPEVIPDLLAKWAEGYQVVYAVRASREGETWTKKFLAAAFYKVFFYFAEVKVPMNTGDFRLVDRRVVRALRQVREVHRYVRGLTSWAGFTQCAVSYNRAARHAGETKYPVWKSAKLAWDAVTSFSGKPLRLMTGIGSLVALIGVLVAMKVIAGKILHPESLVPGWATLVAVVLFLGGLQLACLGLVGQYVGRIFEESKKRPLYIVRETVGLPERADEGNK